MPDLERLEKVARLNKATFKRSLVKLAQDIEEHSIKSDRLWRRAKDLMERAGELGISSVAERWDFGMDLGHIPFYANKSMEAIQKVVDEMEAKG